MNRLVVTLGKLLFFVRLTQDGSGRYELPTSDDQALGLSLIHI
jgi:hypothetical protein